jgi:hypothetical protein
MDLSILPKDDALIGDLGVLSGNPVVTRAQARIRELSRQVVGFETLKVQSESRQNFLKQAVEFAENLLVEHDWVGTGSHDSKAESLANLELARLRFLAGLDQKMTLEALIGAANKECPHLRYRLVQHDGEAVRLFACTDSKQTALNYVSGSGGRLTIYNRYARKVR